MMADRISAARSDLFPSLIVVSNTVSMVNEIIPVSTTNISCGLVGRIVTKSLKVPTLIVMAITPRFPAATIRLMNAAIFLFLVSFMFFSNNVVEAQRRSDRGDRLPPSGWGSLVVQFSRVLITFSTVNSRAKFIEDF